MHSTRWYFRFARGWLQGYFGAVAKIAGRNHFMRLLFLLGLLCGLLPARFGRVLSAAIGVVAAFAVALWWLPSIVWDGVRRRTFLRQ
jgi:hypothetical protein